MPNLASSNRVSLGAIAEVTWGVTPASPTFKMIRFKGESLNYNASFKNSEEIRADRMTADTVKTSQMAEGGFDGELSWASFDDFIEAAMCGTWVTTGTVTSAATDIGINKTGNVYTLTSGATNWTTKSLVVGQDIAISGFAQKALFYGEIVSIAAAALVILPSVDLTTVAAGPAITVTPLNFVRNGTTKRSFTIQKTFNDLSVVTYQNFRGWRAGSMKMNFAVAAIAQISFGGMAADGDMTTTQFGSTTLTPVNTNPVINSVDNVLSVVLDGTPAVNVLYANSISIELDNALRSQEAVGTLGLIGIEYGRAKVTGSLEIYFADSALFAKYRAATAVSLKMFVTDPNGKGYIITLPKAKFTKMEIVAGSLDQDVFAKADYEAMVNAAGTYEYQISKIP